tara:strand:- start:2814 stop:3260 length:447 start_codon:yes stop_codon:yes gene_type:complete
VVEEMVGFLWYQPTKRRAKKTRELRLVLDLPLFLSSFVLSLQSHRVHLFDKREIFWEEDYLIEISSFLSFLSHRSDKRRESTALFFVGVFLFRFFPRPLVSGDWSRANDFSGVFDKTTKRRQKFLKYLENESNSTSQKKRRHRPRGGL